MRGGLRDVSQYLAVLEIRLTVPHNKVSYYSVSRLKKVVVYHDWEKNKNTYYFLSVRLVTELFVYSKERSLS